MHESLFFCSWVTQKFKIYCVTISKSSHIVNKYVFYLASNMIYLHIMIPFHFYIHILCGFLYVLIRFIYVSPQHKGPILSQISEIELAVMNKLLFTKESL